MAVGVEADERLKDRGGQLKRERDHPDLKEAQRVSLFQQWIDGRNQRLHHIVQHVRQTETDQNRKCCRRRGLLSFGDCGVSRIDGDRRLQYRPSGRLVFQNSTCGVMSIFLSAAGG